MAQSMEMVITHISLSTHGIVKVDKGHARDDRAEACHDYALPDIKIANHPTQISKQTNPNP